MEISKLQKIKVGVLGGGISNEREISLESAKAVFAALAQNRIKCVFIEIGTANEESLKKILSAHNLDIAFIALHGEFGEDGRIQKILEEIKISYTGSGPEASWLAMDKIASKKIFVEKRIPTANFQFFEEGEKLTLQLKYPLVVKPHFCGSSIGVSIVRSKTELNEAVKLAFSYQKKIILEDYIEGKELSVGILADEPLGVVEIIPKKGYYDFHSKYTDGATDFVAPCPLENKIYKSAQEAALSAHKALCCRHFSRVDIRLGKDNIPYVLEVNSIPGLTSHSLLPLCAKAKGISFDQLILTMVKLALEDKFAQEIEVIS